MSFLIAYAQKNYNFLFHMVLYGFPHKLLVKLVSFFLKTKSLIKEFLRFNDCPSLSNLLQSPVSSFQAFLTE